MSVDEVRMVRAKLEELVGVSGAEILLDRPSGGWDNLVTNHTLGLRFGAFEERFARYEQHFDHKLEALESRTDRKFETLEHKIDLQRAELIAEMDRRFRQQTLVMVSTFVALAGVMVAAIRL